MPMPTKRTPEIVDEVLLGLSSGKTLTSLCEKLGFHTTTWHDWCDHDEALRIAHGRARTKGFDVIAEDCVRIADGSERDTVITETGERPNAEWIQRSKLRVETRLKLLAKWDPKRYGDRMDVNHSGSIDLAGRLAAARQRVEGEPDVSA